MSSAFFTTSWIGMYLAQSFLHSLIAAIIVDRSLAVWNIRNSRVRQRFRSLILYLPLVSFPAYHFLSPSRAALVFRTEALFDSGRWLGLEIGSTLPLHLFFLLLLVLTALLFIVQEFLPVLRHTFAAEAFPPGGASPLPGSPAFEAAEGLSAAKPALYVIPDPDPLLLSTTGASASISLSTGLIEALSVEQLRGALAHEIAHIQRNRKPLLIVLFLLRVLLFFNPVVLLEFRRIVREEERICDDIAVSLTGNPQALAGALRMLYPRTGPSARTGKTLPAVKESLEEYGHALQLGVRIRRLEQGEEGKDTGSHWLPFGMTAAAVVLINYFVV
ncbi:MAG: M56 family metallopeptidase [Thermodesulfovibrionales bacterium]